MLGIFYLSSVIAWLLVPVESSAMTWAALAACGFLATSVLFFNNKNG